ncbi:MAG: hypothetical protein AAF637_19375 [Pseudomonadota bacterium]
MSFDIERPAASLLGTALLAMALLPAQVAAQEYEAAPVFQASEILPADLISGPGFEVQPEVPNDGYVNLYEVRTPEGKKVEVQSTELLKIRIQELNALVQMNELAGTSVFKDAAIEAAKSPFVFAKDVVTSPIDTMGGVVKGTGQFFKNIGHAMFGSASEQEEGVVGATLGTAAAKRAFAEEFQVDPYSTNEPMQSRLTDLSWTAFAGGMTTGVAMGAVAGEGAIGTVLEVTSFGGDMNSLIYDNPPEQLKVINAEKLEAMGVNQDIATAFLNHPLYSPTRKTYIVGALEQMDGVEDREMILDLAVTVANEPDTFLWQKGVEMMAGYHNNVAPVLRIARIGSWPLLQNNVGTVVFVLPNDYIAWTEDLAAEAAEAGIIEADIGIKELWLSGTVSPLAHQNFEALGWTVEEDKLDALRLK